MSFNTCSVCNMVNYELSVFQKPKYNYFKEIFLSTLLLEKCLKVCENLF